MRNPRLLAVAVTVLAVLLPQAASAAHAAEASSVTWAIQPASADGPDTRVSIRQQIDPGAASDDRFALTNFSSAPATFHIYANDGILTEDESFDIPAAGTAPKDSGAWVGFALPDGSVLNPLGGFDVMLEAEQSIVIPFEVRVPEDATPGDHPLGIVAELTSEDGAAVQVASRAGLRVHLRVTGEVHAAAGITISQAGWTPSLNPFSPGTVTLRVESANRGNVRLGAHAVVRVAGPFGLLPAAATVTHRELLPGGRVVDTVSFPAWGLVHLQGEAGLSGSAVGEDVIGPEPFVAERFSVWAIPYSQIALLALLAAVAGWLVRLRRRRQASMEARIDEAVAAAIGQRP